jgi:cupin superfamily acireductone dioxygenase involved in methionine salvage
MLSDITTGNAAEDGEEFRFWFVGQIEKWCRSKGVDFDANRFGLRITDNIEIKWGIYKKGDKRTEWASCSDRTAMSVLISGDFIFTFREVSNKNNIKKVRLKKQGDYVIWREDVEHTWKMIKNSVILTMRW